MTDPYHDASDDLWRDALKDRFDLPLVHPAAAETAKGTLWIFPAALALAALGAMWRLFVYFKIGASS